MGGFGATAASATFAATRDEARPLDGALDVDLAWMSAHSQDWDDLVGRAQDPSPFFSRHVIDAHVANGIAPPPRFATVWRSGRLVALLPYRRRPIGLVPGRVAWGSPFVTSSNPLVARDSLDENIAALLSACRTIGGCWLLPRLTLDDAVGSSLLRQMGGRGFRSAVLDPFARPVLERRESGTTFEAGLSPGRRKDLRRRRRRLDEAGTVTVRSLDGGADLQDGIEAFLALEALGWKGQRGTALASRPSTAAFARALLRPEGGPVRGRVDLLCLDERPVAASLALIAGRTAYLLKSAYDEELARYAPGVLLETEIVRAMHDTGFADRLDSATEPGTPLDALYTDRAAIGDLLFASAPGVMFDAGLASERARRALREQVKRGLRTLKGRLRG